MKDFIMPMIGRKMRVLFYYWISLLVFPLGFYSVADEMALLKLEWGSPVKVNEQQLENRETIYQVTFSIKNPSDHKTFVATSIEVAGLIKPLAETPQTTRIDPKATQNFSVTILPDMLPAKPQVILTTRILGYFLNSISREDYYIDSESYEIWRSDKMRIKCAGGPDDALQFETTASGGFPVESTTNVINFGSFLSSQERLIKVECENTTAEGMDVKIEFSAETDANNRQRFYILNELKQPAEQVTKFIPASSAISFYLKYKTPDNVTERLDHFAVVLITSQGAGLGTHVKPHEVSIILRGNTFHSNNELDYSKGHGNIQVNWKQNPKAPPVENCPQSSITVGAASPNIQYGTFFVGENVRDYTSSGELCIPEVTLYYPADKVPQFQIKADEDEPLFTVHTNENNRHTYGPLWRMSFEVRPVEQLTNHHESSKSFIGDKAQWLVISWDNQERQKIPLKFRIVRSESSRDILLGIVNPGYSFVAPDVFSKKTMPELNDGNFKVSVGNGSPEYFTIQPTVKNPKWDGKFRWSLKTRPETKTTQDNFKLFVRVGDALVAEKLYVYNVTSEYEPVRIMPSVNLGERFPGMNGMAFIPLPKNVISWHLVDWKLGHLIRRVTLISGRALNGVIAPPSFEYEVPSEKVLSQEQGMVILKVSYLDGREELLRYNVLVDVGLWPKKPLISIGNLTGISTAGYIKDRLLLRFNFFPFDFTRHSFVELSAGLAVETAYQPQTKKQNSVVLAQLGVALWNYNRSLAINPLLGVGAWISDSSQKLSLPASSYLEFAVELLMNGQRIRPGFCGWMGHLGLSVSWMMDYALQGVQGNLYFGLSNRGLGCR